jgi:carbonic anhydrase/acetyltransferase-like protein (isoleucine patch superfamily)
MVKDTGNKVSRRATISGPQNIILGGKTIISNGAIIRGDLKRAGPGHAVVISLGRYCLVGEGCVMRCVSPAPSVESPNHPSDASWLAQAALQDLPRHIQLLSNEDR